MGTAIYFKSVNTGRRYKVLKWNKETQEILLQGEFATFTEKYDKERFKELGYVLEQGE